MPTEKPRITFALDAKTLKAVEDYKFKHRAKNQSQAIISLIEKGLEVVEAQETKQTKTSPAPEGAREESYISMESSNRLYDALIASGLIVDDDVAPEDMKFLMHVADLVDYWFSCKQAK